jgi:hypothetical protein
MAKNKQNKPVQTAKAATKPAEKPAEKPQNVK